ncbi:MAG TPA: hypothetical protein VHC70_10480 [Phycisphaerales bacterium]|jgi:hypothetical protein|nr:hypothetical protein [Phycisphaerales bacterium]
MPSPGSAASWDAVLAAGVAAQRLVPGSIAVGGAAAALYAHHRFSQDTDHLVPGLVTRFDSVRESLEASPSWKTARVQAPVLILGSINGVEVGFRQPRRKTPVDTQPLETSSGPIVVPTLDEMIGMKAYMAYSRNATRDFLDFAALASVAGEAATIASVLKSDERYGDLQTTSVLRAICGVLIDPRPYDLGSVDLSNYKGLLPGWRDWNRTVEVCRGIGQRVAAQSIIDA